MAESSPLADLLAQLPRERGSVLPALLLLQRELGYVSNEAIEAIAAHTMMTPSEVDGIATGYPDLRRARPQGILVRVCVGLSCGLEGSQELREELERDQDTLGIQVETTPCTFSCATAPVVEICGEYLGRATRASVEAMIRAEASREIA